MGNFVRYHPVTATSTKTLLIINSNTTQ
jgi:hypothetical protein